MLGSLTSFSSQAEETTVKGMPCSGRLCLREHDNELAGRETGDRKTRKQQLEMRVYPRAIAVCQARS